MNELLPETVENGEVPSTYTEDDIRAGMIRYCQKVRDKPGSFVPPRKVKEQKLEDLGNAGADFLFGCIIEVRKEAFERATANAIAAGMGLPPGTKIVNGIPVDDDL